MKQTTRLGGRRRSRSDCFRASMLERRRAARFVRRCRLASAQLVVSHLKTIDRRIRTLVPSGAGTNLKVGRGHQSGTKLLKKSLSCPPLFWLQKVQLVVLVSAFVVVSTVWSVSCLLFFYSRCPRAQPFVKVEGTCPLCPMESAPLLVPNPGVNYPSLIMRPSNIDNGLLCFLSVF